MKWLTLVLASLAGCATTVVNDQPPVEDPLPTSSDARPPAPLLFRVAGEGTELHPVRVDATIGELHDALLRSTARRVTSPAAEAAGLEILVLDEEHVEGLIRGVRSTSSLELAWMGVPVRWHRTASGPECELRLRSWPIITELGPRCVVEYRLVAADRTDVHDELLLVPGESLAFAAGVPGWPAPMDLVEPGASPAACAMGWEAVSEADPMGLVLLVPRFDGRQ